MENRVKIAVRLDDITPDMDWERFLSFKELLDQYQVKPLIGVVPDNRDENLMKRPISDKAPQDFWQYIKELKKQGYVIAMHGFRHTYTTHKGGLFPLNDLSEFAGLPYEEQRRMLEEGKKILQEKGIDTDIFMAPAHSYDPNTLRALKDTGFQRVTDGFGSSPYHCKGLVFYPISFRLSKTLKKKKGYSTLVVHTDTLSEEDFRRYEEYFEKSGACFISYGEYLQVPWRERTLPGRLLEWCMAEGKHLVGKLR